MYLYTYVAVYVHMYAGQIQYSEQIFYNAEQVYDHNSWHGVTQHIVQINNI